MKVFNIAIIGVGQIGSRHLQSLKKLRLNINIELVSRSEKSLEIAKLRYNELPNNQFVKQIKYYKNINSISNNIDIVIVATNSDVRKEIIEELVNTKKIRFFILEKVTFPSINDFINILKLFKDKQIKSWVNCPYRVFEHNKYLKDVLKDDVNITFKFEGNNWGLACNAIHFLDLIGYLCDDKIDNLDNSLLDQKIHKSKRKGFLEFTGTLLGSTEKGRCFKLISHDDNDIDSTFTIHTDDKIYTTNYTQNKLSLYNKIDKTITELNFDIIYQSDLTHHIVNEILEYESCSLSTLEESYFFHKPMLETFQNHLKKVTGVDYNFCPIT